MRISLARLASVWSWAALAALFCGVLFAQTAGATSTSLWKLNGSAPQPGPAALYERPAKAAQLENAPGSIWRAKPILISGASSYRSNEFVYQGYLYDDHGAKLVTDPSNPMTSNPENRSGGDLFSAPNGTYDYPSGPGYDENAANLIEFRTKVLSTKTAFRVSLNTLEDANLIGIAIAIGGKEGVTHPFPFGANVVAPAEFFLTIHGATAVLTNAETGAVVPGPAPNVKVDVPRRQITAFVPHSEWQPRQKVVRLAAAVGLWDNATNSYLLPKAERSATEAGGAGEMANPPAFYDVAFRWNSQEAMPGTPNPETTSDPAWWREHAQAKVLASGDISAFHAEVDYNKVAEGESTDLPGQPTGVPQSGAMDRILASHFSEGQGTNYATGGCGKANNCSGAIRGQLQPYAIYVPSGSPPAGGWGLTLLLHSLSANYNQYLGTHNQSQFANRPSGSIVITPTGRGPDGWYYGHAGANTFETWADVAARYPLNPTYTEITGYSMGGYGTYKFSSQFPDLFAKAQPTVGPPALGIWVPPGEPTGGTASLTQRMLASVRNIPFLIWDETSDELVPIAGVREQVKRFDELGYRYRFDEFHAGDHLALAINDEFKPAAEFLDGATVTPNPPHVSYTYNPTMDFPQDGTTAGHAYWLYAVALRNGSGSAPIATVDVRSEGFGVGDPPANATETEPGVLTGGMLGAIPYTEERKTWKPAPAAPIANKLDINATNIAHVSIDAKRAKVSCSAAFNVSTDGPVEVTLADCANGATVTKTFG
jgi:hypothetical protein